MNDVEPPGTVLSLSTRACVEAAIRWGLNKGPLYIDIEDLETTDIPDLCVDVVRVHGVNQLRVEVIPFVPGPPTDKPF